MRSLTPTRVHRRTAESGFSLIVMSILITAAAIVMVSMLPGDGAGDYNQKTISNVTKLERVEEAMRSFMAFNGRRPCPAQGSYPLNSKYFGQEAGTPGTCTGNVAPTPNAPMGPDSGTGRIVAGTIPVRTLGLPEDYAFDSYGRRFTYTVDTWATKQASCQSMYAKKSTGDLVIEDGTHTVIDNVMYAYTSHGPSGYGAFPGPGSAVAGRINSGSTDADMQTNAGVDALGASSTFTYNTTNFTNIRIKKDRALPNLPTTTGFDDLVWYRDDLKNTCCLGQTCVPLGIRIDGTNPSGYAAQEIGLHGMTTMDINGDGKPDLVIVGADAHVYVVFGDSRANLIAESPLQLSSLNGTNGIDINLGRNTWPGNGGVGVTKGDFNGDGIDDLAITENDCWPYALYIVFGHTGSWNSPVTVSTLNTGTTPIVYKSTAPNNFLSCSASSPMVAAWIHGTTNTVNGITYKVYDLVIGDMNATGANAADNAGVVNVIFGNTNPASMVTTVAGLNGTNGFQIQGYKNYGTVGYSVSAGDFNGDGFTDIAIGAANYGGTGQDSNGYIIWGQNPSTFNWTSYATPINVNPAVMTPAQGQEINRNGSGVWIGYGTSDGNFGWSTLAGDVNGDGITDLLFESLSGYSNPGSNGTVHVIFGTTDPNVWGWPNAASPATSLNVGSATFNGTNGTLLQANQEGGSYSMPYFAGMADTTGTGRKTIVTEVAAWQGGGMGNIEEYLAFYPQAGAGGSWLNPTNAGLFSSNSMGFRFNGFSLTSPGSHATLGDINGDGISDYLMTDPGATVAGKANAGKVYVVKGQVAPLPSLLTPSTYSGYGYEIDGASAGDLTGGSIRVLDFDNDGHTDVAVSAPYASPNGKTNAGSVYVVWGKQAGWKTSIDLSTIGN